jgi:hypothetical protein
MLDLVTYADQQDAGMSCYRGRRTAARRVCCTPTSRTRGCAHVAVPVGATRRMRRTQCPELDSADSAVGLRLQAEQLGVAAAPRHEFSVGSLFEDASVLQHDDAIR